MSSTPDTETDTPRSAASRLFDIRLLIGGLFVVYGIMLMIASAFTSDKELHKAADININLWLGIAMLVLGLLFLLWRMLNPARPPEPEHDAEARRDDH